MQLNDFLLVNADTDSIMISKRDGNPFSEEERKRLLQSLNSQFPEAIKWEDDGYYHKVVVLKAKNYILYDGKKIKKKGSSLKSSKTEPALRDFMSEVIDCLLFDKQDQLLNVYHSYILRVYNIKDIKPWTSKKTITEKVLNAERTTERKVLAALNGRSSQMGDKIYVYFDVNEQLKMAEDWTGDHDPMTLIEKVYKTLCIFKNVIDINLFPKYHLKKQAKNLEALLTASKEMDTI